MKMNLIDRIVMYSLLVLAIAGFSLMIFFHSKAINMCEVVTIASEDSDVLNGKGIYTNNGIIAFQSDKGVEFLFEEMAHSYIAEDYVHYCVEGYEAVRCE